VAGSGCEEYCEDEFTLLLSCPELFEFREVAEGEAVEFIPLLIVLIEFDSLDGLATYDAGIELCWDELSIGEVIDAKPELDLLSMSIMGDSLLELLLLCNVANREDEASSPPEICD
jgi:hypothetical protein